MGVAVAPPEAAALAVAKTAASAAAAAAAGVCAEFRPPLPIHVGLHHHAVAAAVAAAVAGWGGGGIRLEPGRENDPETASRALPPAPHAAPGAIAKVPPEAAALAVAKTAASAAAAAAGVCAEFRPPLPIHVGLRHHAVG